MSVTAASAPSMPAIPLTPFATVIAPGRVTEEWGFAPILERPTIVFGGIDDAIGTAQELSSRRGGQAIALVQSQKGVLLVPMLDYTSLENAIMPTGADARRLRIERDMTMTIARDGVGAIAGPDIVARFTPGAERATIIAG